MVNVAELRKYLNNDFNILLQGKHGTGKTAMLKEACQQENLTLKIFNAASMDPYTDFVGVPKFATDENGNEFLKAIRPHDVDDADVIFIDELNRAGDPKITNATFELIQFHSINGEKLPKLKCVIAAQNPPDDDTYDVQPLDPALVDRFHITLDVSPSPDRAYFTKKFNDRVATALIAWFLEHDSERFGYISPRRLEMLGEVFMKTRTIKSLTAAMPPEGKFDTMKLFALLDEATRPVEESKKNSEKRVKSMDNLVGTRASKKTSGTSVHRVPRPVKKNTYVPKDIDLLAAEVAAYQVDYLKLRTAVKPSQMVELLNKKYTNNIEKNIVRGQIIQAISSQINPTRIVNEYLDVFNNLNNVEIDAIVSKWSSSKASQVSREFWNVYSSGNSDNLLRKALNNKLLH